MSPFEHFDVVVIGSGPAGQKAAIQAAKAGRRVAIVESERNVGGACVHRGTIPSKALRERALQLDRFRRNADVFAVTMHEGLELRQLTGPVADVVDVHARYIARQLVRNNVERLHGRARFTSAESIEVTHLGGTTSRLTAERVIIATGSRPRHPPEIPIDHERILDSDSILSMTYLPASLTVLGAGVIASEYASTFASLGVEVTMIDRAERPLQFLDSELTDVFVATFERYGGRFLGGAEIANVGWDGVAQVVTTLGDGRTIESEKALVALGRAANLERLEIANAGLEMTARGLLEVDASYRTAVNGIYAVGDVIGSPALASTAMEQGRRAACYAFGIDPGGTADTTPIGIYSIPELSAVGLDELAAFEQHGGVVVGRARFDEIARGQICGVEDGLLKMIADPAGRKLLGVQIVGEGATELIHLGQVGLLAGCDTDFFVENVFNFPTMAEAYRVAALHIAEQRAQLARSRVSA